MPTSAIELDGQIRVFDTTIQIPECPHIFLWEPESQDMAKYLASYAKTRMRQVPSSSRVAAGMAAYAIWHANNAASWIAEQRRYYCARSENEHERAAAQQEKRKRQAKFDSLFEEAERLAGADLALRHATHIGQYGVEYKGLSRAFGSGRVNHCYHCKSKVDTAHHFECGACGWLVCTCGRCGCGFQDL